jgi:hypothetical protein
MSEKAPIYSKRSQLRIAHLKSRTPGRSMVMNVKIPVSLNAELRQIADSLGASKTEVVLALLNEGLEAWRKKRG